MKRAAPEFQLQLATVDLLTVAGVKGLVWFAVPNGEKRNAITGARLKRMGVRAGVADLILLIPGFIFAALELKAGKGRLSPEQISFMNAVQAAGGSYAVARTMDEVESVLSHWGAIRTTKRAAA